MRVATTTRRGTLLLVAMMVALLTVSGVALAKAFYGTNGPDRIGGTNYADLIKGYGGNDVINGYNGADSIYGGPGGDRIADGTLHDRFTDHIFAGPGNDRINVNSRPAHKDIVNCGSGRDRVTYDYKDVLRSCNR